MIAFGESVGVSELRANIWRYAQPASVSEAVGRRRPANGKHCYLFQ